MSSTPIHTTSRRALAVLTAVVALAAGCSGDDTSGSASTTKARDGSTSSTSTTADGDGTARAPLDATPVRLVSLDLDANDPIDLAYRSDSTSLLVAERGGTVREAQRAGDGFRFTDEPVIDLEVARALIDTLEVLKKRSEGHRTGQESKFLELQLTNLRLNFLEVQKEQDKAGDGEE